MNLRPVVGFFKFVLRQKPNWLLLHTQKPVVFFPQKKGGGIATFSIVRCSAISSFMAYEMLQK